MGAHGWVVRAMDSVLTLKVLNFWIFISYCSLKPLWSGMGEVVPARTIPSHCASIVMTSTLRVKRSGVWFPLLVMCRIARQMLHAASVHSVVMCTGQNTKLYESLILPACFNLVCTVLYLINSYSASHGSWCTATLWNRIMIAQCEGMGKIGSARYEPTLLPPCPSIRVLSYSNCQEIHPFQQAGLAL